MQFRVDEYKNKFMEVAIVIWGFLDTVHHAVHGLGYVLCINISPILNFSLSYY